MGETAGGALLTRAGEVPEVGAELTRGPGLSASERKRKRGSGRAGSAGTDGPEGRK
jgi:hypothetical protein